MFLLYNPQIQGVSTATAAVTAITQHEGVLYGAAESELLSFDGELLTPTVVTGKLQFGRKAKIRKVTLGVDSGRSTVVHSIDGRVFPQTVRVTSDTDVEHATNAAYEGRDHQFTVTFTGELRYIDLAVVTTRRQRGQNNG